MPAETFEPLDRQRLLASPVLAQFELHDSLGSTQDRGHDVARAVDPGPLPLLIAAEEQTAGRGRGANRWWTGRGSLAVTVVFDAVDWGLAREARPERSLAVAVAIVETARRHVPGLPVGLHWPNDVFVEGKKLAGVLVDVLPGSRHVIGIGLNVNNSFAGAPDEVRSRAASLCELAGRPLDRTAVLLDLVGNLQRALADCTSDPEGFGRQFNELCLQIGSELTVEVGSQRTTGVCAGIAHDGALILDGDDGWQRFYSGVLR